MVVDFCRVIAAAGFFSVAAEAGVVGVAAVGCALGGVAVGGLRVLPDRLIIRFSGAGTGVVGGATSAGFSSFFTGEAFGTSFGLALSVRREKV